MDLSKETDEFYRDIDCFSVGCLPVSTRTLELKLSASEEAERRVRDQYLYLQEKLKEKDDLIDRVRAESTMNAQAVKKFVEENQKLALECANLLNQCKKWEKECSMYDCDREALMDFGNEADHRREEAESQVRELEEELSKLSKELQCYKNQAEGQQVGEMTKTASAEHSLVDTLISTLISKDDVVSTARSFLEANSGVEVCQKMLEMFESLKPSTQKVLALASEVKILQKEKDNLRNNLTTAEEEVKVLDEENSMLEKENRRLTNLLHKERHLHDSGGKHNSASLKDTICFLCRVINGICQEGLQSYREEDRLIESGSPRKPLSPLRQNTPESQMHKK
ncbi:hypothetical protein Tco_1116047 [Tanacetum coccineum]